MRPGGSSRSSGGSPTPPAPPWICSIACARPGRTRATSPPPCPATRSGRPPEPAAPANHGETMPQLLESVPNISEGQRPEVVDAIVEAVRRSGPVRVLDRSSDPDHNRTVLTLAGDPQAVLQGLEALVAACVERLDLTRHRGRHPRMGAVDVIPL